MSTKYSDFTRGEEEALLNAIGGVDVARKILKGELKFSITEDAIKIVAAIKKLFDKNGRRIKPDGLVAYVCDPDKDYYLKQPVIDYKERMSRLFEAADLNVFGTLMSSSYFETQSLALIDELQNNEQLKNLLKGVYLPIIIPKTNLTDLNEIIEKFVLKAGKSYKKNFSNRLLTNYCKGELKRQFAITEGSRYDWLIEKIVKESFVGIYFPTVLQGYSINAQRQQMSSLPESLILSGPIDVAIALTMYPDVLGRDEKTPAYDCSAIQWQLSDDSLQFCIVENSADFSLKPNFPNSDSFQSGGLLFVKR